MTLGQLDTAEETGAGRMSLRGHIVELDGVDDEPVADVLPTKRPSEPTPYDREAT